MKLLEIIKFEYTTKVKTKGFIISTILIPALFLLITTLPTLLMRYQTKDIKKIIFIDRANIIPVENLKKLGEKIHTKFLIDQSYKELTKDSLLSIALQNNYFGYIMIPENVLEKNSMDFYLKNPANFSLIERLNSFFRKEIIKKRAEQANLSKELIDKITKRTKTNVYKITPKGKAKEDKGASFFLAYFLGIALYVALLIGGTMVLNSVVEEKSSRVYEIILSSVKPFTLLSGKLIAIALVGLTQFAIWFAFGGFLLSNAFAFMPSTGFISGIIKTILNQPISTWLLFIFYFLAGYFQFAALYALVASTVDSTQDAQQMQTPVTLLIILNFLFMFFIINNPESTLAVILSILPLTAPIIMMVRIGSIYPPVSHIIFSIISQIIGVIVILFLSAKIYRVGILMYGKPPKFTELIKWLKKS